MKKYIDKNGNIYLVGETTDVKAIFGSIANWFYLVNSDTIMSMLIHDELAEYKDII